MRTDHARTDVPTTGPVAGQPMPGRAGAKVDPITGPRLYAVTERDRQLIAARIASPIRPLDRTSAPVDGLALFDQARSPTML